MLLSLSAWAQVEGAVFCEAITDVYSGPDDSPSGILEKNIFNDDSDFGVTTTNDPNPSTSADGSVNSAESSGAMDRLDVFEVGGMTPYSCGKAPIWGGKTPTQKNARNPKPEAG